MPSRLEHFSTADGHFYQTIKPGQKLWFVGETDRAYRLTSGIVLMVYPSGDIALVKMDHFDVFGVDPETALSHEIGKTYVSESLAKIALGDKFMELGKQYVTKGRLLKLEGLGHSKAQFTPKGSVDKPTQVDEDDLPPAQRLKHEP